MKLVSFERPDEGDYRSLAVAIGASILMKLRKVLRSELQSALVVPQVKRGLVGSKNEQKSASTSLGTHPLQRRFYQHSP
jgi:hypothetical protein